MKKYNITYTITGTATITVEAENEADAVKSINPSDIDTKALTDVQYNTLSINEIQDKKPQSGNVPIEWEVFRQTYADFALALCDANLPIMIGPRDMDILSRLAHFEDEDVEAVYICHFYDLPIGSEQNEAFIELFKPLKELYNTDAIKQGIEQQRFRSGLSAFYRTQGKKYPLLADILEKTTKRRK